MSWASASVFGQACSKSSFLPLPLVPSLALLRNKKCEEGVCQGKAGKCTCPQTKSDFPQIKAQIIHSKLHSLLEGGKSICLASPQPAAGRRGATIPMLHSCYFTNQAWECLCCVFSCCFYTERETPWGQCCEKTEVETHPCTIGRFFLFCTERGKVWPSHHTFSCEVILWCVSGKGVGFLIALPSSTSIQPATLCSQCLVFSQGRRIWERLTVIDTLQMANTLIWEGRGA